VSEFLNNNRSLLKRNVLYKDFNEEIY